MVSFRSIDKENFYPLLKMDPGDGGKFVASNAVSLAEAWLYYESHDTHPFAVYHAIAREHQGRGCGTAALSQFIALARESGKYACIAIGYMEGNDRARHIYEKLGFRPTGLVEDGEIIMRLDL